MAKYIKSHSNYVINEKHQTSNDGTIYERDITTIGGRDRFAPGQVPIYRSGNFVITTNGEVQNSYKVDTNNSWNSANGDKNDVWTLSSISANSIDKTASDDKCIEVKQDIHNLTDFAYWGSCSELFRASVGDILNRYPGELYLPYNDVSVFTRTWNYTANIDENSNEVVKSATGNKWYYLETGEEYTGSTSNTKVVTGTDLFFSIEEILGNETISGSVDTTVTPPVVKKVPQTIENITAIIGQDDNGNDIEVKLPDVTYRWGEHDPKNDVVGVTAYYDKNSDPKPFVLTLYNVRVSGTDTLCYKFIDNEGNDVYFSITTFDECEPDAGTTPTEVKKTVYQLDNPFNLDMLSLNEAKDDENPLKYLRTNDNYKCYEAIDEDGDTYEIELTVNFLASYLDTEKFFRTSPSSPSEITVGENAGHNLNVSVDLSSEYQLFGSWAPNVKYCPGDLLGVVNIKFTKNSFETQLTNFSDDETSRELPSTDEDEDRLITVNSSYRLNDAIDLPIYAFIGDDEQVVYTVDFDLAPQLLGVHIRPKEDYIEDYVSTLDTFERLLINFSTTPLHTAQFTIIDENEFGYYTHNEFITFPTGNGGYNLAIDGPAYGLYLSRLMEIGEFYDERFSDNIWRSMTHEAIKNLDWSQTKNGDDNKYQEYEDGFGKMEKTIRVMGRYFDALRVYVENLKNTNSVDYGDNSLLPDYFMSDKLEEFGWNAAQILPYKMNIWWEHNHSQISDRDLTLEDEKKNTKYYTRQNEVTVSGRNYVINVENVQGYPQSSVTITTHHESETYYIPKIENSKAIVLTSMVANVQWSRTYMQENLPIYFSNGLYKITYDDGAEKAAYAISKYSPDGKTFALKKIDGSSVPPDIASGKTSFIYNAPVITFGGDFPIVRKFYVDTPKDPIIPYERYDANGKDRTYMPVYGCDGDQFDWDENSEYDVMADEETGLFVRAIKKYASNLEYTYPEVNVEFMKRLVLNSKSILKKKGTIAGIESILAMFGLKSKTFAEKAGLTIKKSPTSDVKVSDYDFDVKEYTVVVDKPIVDEHDDVTGSDFLYDHINTLKDIVYDTPEFRNGINVPYEGLPVIYYEYEPDELKGTQGERNKPIRFIYPNFDSTDEYDGNPYYQMMGGWLQKTPYTFDIDNNILSTDVTDKIYSETAKDIKTVANIEELIALPYYDLSDGDVVRVKDATGLYVIVDGVVYELLEDNSESIKRFYFSVTVDGSYVNIGNTYFEDTITVSDPHYESGKKKYILTDDAMNGEDIRVYVDIYGSNKNIMWAYSNISSISNVTLYDGTILDDSLTNYFVISDAYSAGEISNNGWRRIKKTDPEYYLVNNLRNNYEGNNPHKGNMRYDSGEEYFSYFTKLFKYALEDNHFSEKLYAEYGEDAESVAESFRFTISGADVSSSCGFSYGDSLHEGNGYFSGSNGSSYDESLYNKHKVLIECDKHVLNGEEPCVEKKAVDYMSDKSLSPYYGDILAGMFGDRVINTKVIDIVFYLNADFSNDAYYDENEERYSINGQCMIKYIEDAVMPYLSQMIPSSTICRISYETKKP